MEERVTQYVINYGGEREAAAKCYVLHRENCMKGRVDRLFFIMNLEYLIFKSTYNSSYVVVVVVDW